MTDYTRALPAEKLAQLPLFLAEMCRGISRRRLRLYPHVREVLDVLRSGSRWRWSPTRRAAYARGELHQVGLLDYFDPIVVSGDHGYRKPDRRLFQLALDGMGVAAEDAVHVGNDMYRDIFGAREARPADRHVRLRPGHQGTSRHASRTTPSPTTASCWTCSGCRARADPRPPRAVAGQ